ncbi:MAG: DEAD/DEAH box helicase [Nitrospinae bacterium]|nr:DEAD/DEAH box helicase [Nitrospinota bacterium]MBL7020823.1 DEAD/DEAH box helicase [Nitrospinaceae bacterium]
MLMESTTTGFDALNLSEPICRAVRGEKYDTPTPIQQQAIPHLLQGRDLLGCAQTGTGKTAAFALPILHRLSEKRPAPGSKGPRALILTPTRELAAQISDSFRVYGKHLNLKQTVVYGGVSPKPQVSALRRGVDILIATPGRMIDLYQQRCFRLDQIEVFVLDEADRMLDMGFLPDIKKIYAMTPDSRQSMLFSATLPDDILRLTKQFLNDPAKVSVNPPASTVDRIDQRVLFVDRENKGALLESVLQDNDIHRALVFSRTKHGANRIVKNLGKAKIKADSIHGNKSQAARMDALRKFRSGKVQVLVATDIASRGLDVEGITHVINYELPNEAESYVHRVGRTARAGATGVALSFCDAGEKGYLHNIERTINRVVTVIDDHPYHSESIASKPKRGSAPGRKFSGKRNYNSDAKPGKNQNRKKYFSAKPGKKIRSRSPRSTVSA